MCNAILNIISNNNNNENKNKTKKSLNVYKTVYVCGKNQG